MVEQTLQARSRNELAASLRAKKMKILSIREIRGNIQFFRGKVSALEKANFCRYMAVMIRSGLSASEAVELIYSETENTKMKVILQDMIFTMQEGGEISTVLRKYPEVFDSVFLALVHAGEQSGSLEKTFAYLSKQLYAVHRLNKKIMGALMYPAVIITAMLGVGVLMITFVLPKLSTVFLKMKIPLPLPTKLLLQFGDFMGKNAALAILTILTLAAFFVFLLTYHKTKSVIFKYLSNFPIIKKLCRQIDLARFSRTLATLLQSGVSIITALNIASETLTQFDMQKVAKNFEKGIEEGKTVASLLTTNKKVFPSLMIQTIKTGEKTGALDSVLLELADYYEEELEDGLKEFTTILEPIIMLVIGVAVGAMVIMIIAPIYSVVGNMQTAQGGR
ncbi:MAG: type II secretion system F family protein [Patescibacteria group bacterium]|jgi:type IV pilus assembly protein PilC